MTQSSWEATFKKSKLLHSATVIPALTYESPIWAAAGPAGKIPERIIKPLRSIQRKCLKLVTGAYNFNSSRVLDHECSILPLDIYLKQRRIQHIGLSEGQPIKQTILSACSKISQTNILSENSHTKNRSRYVNEWTKICSNEKVRYR